MIYSKYTDTEIDKLLDSIVILIDTREKVNDHITKYLDDKKVSYIKEKLEHGDYTCKIPVNKELGIYRDIYLNNIISIERKANLEELSSNFTRGRTQIENEFIRAKGKMILLIENSSYEDIIQHNYTTEYNPQSFLGSLKAFENRYNIQTNFVKGLYTGNFIYYSLYYAARELLKNGSIGKAM